MSGQQGVSMISKEKASASAPTLLYNKGGADLLVFPNHYHWPGWGASRGRG